MQMAAPIVMFTYNRPLHTKRTIESLQKAELANQSDLIVFSDGPGSDKDIEKVARVRDYLGSIGGFRSIQINERKENYGLKRSIIGGITDVLKQYGKTIIVEDDLLFSRGYLRYMNRALDFYEGSADVFSVTGYCFPVEIPSGYEFDTYFFYRANSWGWGTWKDRWEKADWEIQDFEEFARSIRQVMLFNRGGDDLFEMLKLQMDGIIDTWDVQWCYAHYKNSGFCVFPVESLVHNIGFDASGVHRVKTDFYDVELSDIDSNDIHFCTSSLASPEIINRIQKYHSYPALKKIRKYFRLNFLRKFGVKM